MKFMKKAFLLLFFVIVFVPSVNADYYNYPSYGEQQRNIDTSNYYNPKESMIWEHPSLLKVYIEDNSDKSYLVKNAFYTWNYRLDSFFNFYFVNDESKADIVCHFLYKTNGDIAGITKPVYRMSREKKKFVAKKAEIIISYSNAYGVFDNDHQYFLSVILHEIGHAVGILNHSNNPEDIMYPSVQMDKNNGKLTQRDINTMKMIYGIK